MNVDLDYDELHYIVIKMGFHTWESSVAERIEKKCRAVMPLAKEQEDAIKKAARISELKTELAKLESG